MAILGIDYGKKRVGLALSESYIQAFPLQIVHHISTEDLLKKIKEVIAQNDVEEVVVGVPENDIIGARKFGQKLADVSKITIHFVLEDLSSWEAQAIKGGSDHNDDLAATLILQEYLETNPRKNG